MKVPGRLARLTINIVDGTALINTTNVWIFSIDPSVSPIGMIAVNGGNALVIQGAEKVCWVSKQKGHWEVQCDLSDPLISLISL